MRITSQIALGLILATATLGTQAIAACPADFHSIHEMVDFVKTDSDVTDITVQTKDIDGDGRDDRLIGVGCGNGGCGYYVFLQTKPGIFHYVGNAGFHFQGFRFFSDQNGVYEIYSYWHMGADNGTLRRYISTGCEFQEVAKVRGTGDLFDFVKDFSPAATPKQ